MSQRPATNHAALLRASAMLRELDAATLEHLASRLDVLALEAGGVLIADGQSLDALYFIVRGAVALSYDPRNNRRVQRWTQGAVIGEHPFLVGDTALGSISAIEDTEIARLSAAELLAVVRQDPTVALAIARSLMRQSRSSERSLLRPLSGIPLLVTHLADSIWRSPPLKLFVRIFLGAALIELIAFALKAVIIFGSLASAYLPVDPTHSAEASRLLPFLNIRREDAVRAVDDVAATAMFTVYLVYECATFLASLVKAFIRELRSG